MPGKMVSPPSRKRAIRFSRISSLTRRVRRRDSEESSLRRSSPSVRGKFIKAGDLTHFDAILLQMSAGVVEERAGETHIFIERQIESDVVHDEGLTSTGVPSTSDLCVLLGK